MSPLRPSPHAAQRHSHPRLIPATAASQREFTSSLWLHFVRSGWARAARGSSCSESDQTRARDFFDYYLFVRLPLRLSHSQRPLSKWAQSQDKALKKKHCFMEWKICSHLFLIKKSLLTAWFKTSVICDPLFNHNSFATKPFPQDNSSIATIPQFILAFHPFDTVSVGSYHRGANKQPWLELRSPWACRVEMPSPRILAGSSTLNPACLFWLRLNHMDV